MNLKEVQEFEIRHEIDCRILSPLDPLTRRLIHRHQPPTDDRGRRHRRPKISSISRPSSPVIFPQVLYPIAIAKIFNPTRTECKEQIGLVGRESVGWFYPKVLN